MSVKVSSNLEKKTTLMESRRSNHLIPALKKNTVSNPSRKKAHKTDKDSNHNSRKNRYSHPPEIIPHSTNNRDSIPKTQSVPWGLAYDFAHISLESQTQETANLPRTASNLSAQNLRTYCTKLKKTKTKKKIFFFFRNCEISTIER